MDIHQLIYASTATVKMDFSQVKDISSRASRNNERYGISGLLVYGGGYFLQILEGRQKEINELYFKVAGDERHKNICLLDYENIAIQRYGKWAMGCLVLEGNDKVSQIVKHYFEGLDFNPYNLSSRNACRLMSDLFTVYSEM